MARNGETTHQVVCEGKKAKKDDDESVTSAGETKIFFDSKLFEKTLQLSSHFSIGFPQFSKYANVVG